MNEWKLTANGYVRVPCQRGAAVDLAAAQVRGSSWRINYRPTRGRRAVSFNDQYHQGATGAGRTLSKNPGVK